MPAKKAWMAAIGAVLMALGVAQVTLSSANATTAIHLPTGKIGYGNVDCSLLAVPERPDRAEKPQRPEKPERPVRPGR